MCKLPVIRIRFRNHRSLFKHSIVKHVKYRNHSLTATLPHVRLVEGTLFLQKHITCSNSRHSHFHKHVQEVAKASFSCIQEIFTSRSTPCLIWTYLQTLAQERRPRHGASKITRYTYRILFFS